MTEEFDFFITTCLGDKSKIPQDKIGELERAFYAGALCSFSAIAAAGMSKDIDAIKKIEMQIFSRCIALAGETRPPGDTDPSSPPPAGPWKN